MSNKFEPVRKTEAESYTLYYQWRLSQMYDVGRKPFLLKYRNITIYMQNHNECMPPDHSNIFFFRNTNKKRNFIKLNFLKHGTF